MASTSISNFISFFTPPKPPPPKTPLLLPSLSSSSSENRAGFVPLVASNEGYNPLSSSSSSDVLNVLYPSVAYANTLFFRSAYNVQVIVDDNETEEKLLGRFRREVMRAGVIQECKRRKFFENKQDEKKRKSREAAKRNRRRFQFSLASILLYALFSDAPRLEVHFRTRRKPPRARRKERVMKTIGSFLKETFPIDIVLFYFSLGICSFARERHFSPFGNEFLSRQVLVSYNSYLGMQKHGSHENRYREKDIVTQLKDFSQKFNLSPTEFEVMQIFKWLPSCIVDSVGSEVQAMAMHGPAILKCRAIHGENYQVIQQGFGPQANSEAL
ncbi:hypothetical protein HYC85_002792 [Camellia sinensis]|uniref:30S ribosomal protein S21, chloroplastic n=1 Tax=Camellia sinensis TaxID=4442 RepID=A0A7J7I9A2_CAMSI|nr:hypothetical protein HYC85_002792 [Camellia sinensis]